MKIIPSSGVIYKNPENKKIGDDIYRNKKGKMSYKEYILMKNQYMHQYTHTEQNIRKKNNILNNHSEKKELDSKKEDKNKIRSKSRYDKIRNYNFKDNITNVKKEEKKNKNYDENGVEVLNENLFKNRKEYRSFRKTFTGKFFRPKVNQLTAYGSFRDKINFNKK